MENKKKKTTKKKIRKRYKVKPRFFCLVFSILIIGGVIYKFSTNVQPNELPNFYGWLSEEVLAFEAEHDNISVIFELEYSDKVRPTRVISQSLQPGTDIGNEMIVLTVQVSKGSQIRN